MPAAAASFREARCIAWRYPRLEAGEGAGQCAAAGEHGHQGMAASPLASSWAAAQPACACQPNAAPVERVPAHVPVDGQPAHPAGFALPVTRGGQPGAQCHTTAASIVRSWSPQSAARKQGKCMPHGSKVSSPPVMIGRDEQRQVGHGAPLRRQRLGAARIAHSVTDRVPRPHAQQLRGERGERQQGAARWAGIGRQH